MTSQTNLLPAPDIARLIHFIRGQRVILDTDLARLYNVQVKRLNEQFRRNRNRFPDDFAFQLVADEWAVLRSQIATSNTSGVSNRSQIVTGFPGTTGGEVLSSQIVTSNSRRGGRRYLPFAFTEHGALMAANILNSARAVAMSVYVIRAFVNLREDIAANAAILRRLAEIEKTLVIHDVTLREILQKLRPLLEPPPLPAKPQIGFHVKEDAIPYRTRRKIAAA